MPAVVLPHRVYRQRMTDTPIESPAADPDALPRPEEEVADAVRDSDDGGRGGSGAAADPQAQPVAGGTDDGPPAQGDGAPDSY